VWCPLREIFDRFSLTIARWLLTSTKQRSQAGNHTTPGDVTPMFAQEAVPIPVSFAPAPPLIPVPGPADSNDRKAATLSLNVALKKRAETAVLRTAAYEGGYSSLSALIEGALRHELERLAVEFNDGVPFPRIDGAFRIGRPLGH
jgi:hypothetical protein